MMMKTMMTRRKMTMMKGMGMGKMTKNDGGSDEVDNEEEEDDNDNQI